ncbi:hypothetical protein FBZ93_111150 [Bradyrhizobium macuxiense]|uniref:Uncharacterized protein n=1 Tax=Bradyrhizobium macuxiense TaxID=1755647 RepID=A0A560LC10_9BRAD|nr:hypothetical protein FBZ93_111150 [Bradyrhizobium macuxiense]
MPYNREGRNLLATTEIASVGVRAPTDLVQATCTDRDLGFSKRLSRSFAAMSRNGQVLEAAAVERSSAQCGEPFRAFRIRRHYRCNGIVVPGCTLSIAGPHRTTSTRRLIKLNNVRIAMRWKPRTTL